MTEPLDQPTIRELKPGDKFVGFLVLRKCDLKTTREGAPYLHLELGDASGRIQGNLWDDAKNVYETLQAGEVVKVQAMVRSFKDKSQLAIERIRKAAPEDGINPESLIPRGDLDVTSLFQRLIGLIDSVQDPHLRKLLHRIFDDPKTAEQFRNAPGGKLWHHAYIGGLMEHTLSVAEICETLTRLYPDINRDMLLSGALLHDIGKLEEYGIGGFIDFTDEGRLWGHIVMGAEKVRSCIAEAEKEGPFPAELKKHLIHLILSHQGELEHGSPVLPSTLEAIILYYSDEMDSKANAIKHIMDRDKEPGRRWSQYVQLLNRFIYLNPPGESDPQSFATK